MSSIPGNVKTGQPIRAEHINAIARAVRNLLRIRGGKGVTVSTDSAGIRISLTAPRDDILLGHITAVNSPNGENTAQDLTQVTYDVVIPARPELPRLLNRAPDFRNVSTGVDGEPAKVGDKCRVYLTKRGPQQEMLLHILTEKTVFFECEPPAQALRDEGTETLRAEVARLSARLAALESGSGSGVSGSATAGGAYA